MEETEMYENINQKIPAAVLFGTGFQDVNPLKIRWQGRDYTIVHIDYKHKLRQGNKILYYFSCSDGANFFELCFDATELSWTLNKVWDENVQ